MNKQIEMTFIDELEQFMKLVEALNAGDQVCPVYLAFDTADLPHLMLATDTIRARFTWQSKEAAPEIKDVIQRLDKTTFVIQPTNMKWSVHDVAFSSVDPTPF